jgi:hypothetical protein
MPILTIFTNVEKTSIPKDFVEETAKSVAQAAGKTKEVSPRKIMPTCKDVGMNPRVHRFVIVLKA